MEMIKAKKKSVSEDEPDVVGSFTEVDSLIGDYCFPDRERSERTISFDSEFTNSDVESSSFENSLTYTNTSVVADVISCKETDEIFNIDNNYNTNLKETHETDDLSTGISNVALRNTDNMLSDNVVDMNLFPTDSDLLARNDGLKNNLNTKNEGCSVTDGKQYDSGNISTAPYNYNIGSQTDEMSHGLVARDHFLLPKENELKPFTESDFVSLYCNQELYNYEIFVNEFIENEVKSGKVVQQKLYQLLTNYLESRESLCRDKLTYKSYLLNYYEFQENIWNLETDSKTQFGECQDGNPVQATYRYEKAHFNESAFNRLCSIIEDMQEFTSENYVSNIFCVQLYKMKVECYIQNLCSNFSYLPHNAPISLHTDSSPRGPVGSNYGKIIMELKDAISVLFSFQRRPIKDEDFIRETRAWLEKLLGILLRVATPHDHLFILNHVLRCPSNMERWACHYIQQPTYSNGSVRGQYYLDHLITVLGAILLSVKDRELFLQEMEIGIEENGAWEIIDSDLDDSWGESVSRFALKEKDVIALLNQIPFGDIFRQILLVMHKNDQDILDVNVTNERDMLRAIAISTLLVNLLEKGLANYDALVYRQFCKRLCQLIIHITCYITDYWQIFRETYTHRCLMDSSMLLRLQTEYDEFMLRAAHSLYLAQNRIGWQYLASLPFNLITSQTLWRLYQYLLHTNSDSHVTSKEFIESIENFRDDDIYYFLTTITNMALNRTLQDWLFIQAVTSQLFQIGFVNSSVRDNCMKSVRILLTNLTNEHPSLISDILMMLKKYFSLVGKSSLYLFKELPLHLWKPLVVDIDVITEWLLSRPLSTWESSLARFIIMNLNWSLDVNSDQLFLSRELHFQMGIIIVRAVITYAEEISNSYSMPQGVTQMVRSIQTPEQTLTSWAWQVLTKLRIHLMDQPGHVTESLINDPQSTSLVPSLNSDSPDMQFLSNGVARNQSIAYYVALLSTDVGHSLPVISEIGFKYCLHLLSACRYSHGLHVISLIVPYLFSSVESVLSSDQFRQVMTVLINVDRVKNYASLQFPGTILLQLASLIQYQIFNHSRYNLNSADPVVEFWMRVLSSLWSANLNSVIFLMDKILATALDNNSLKSLADNILSDLIKDLTDKGINNTSGLSTWFNWASNKTNKLMTLPISLLPAKLSKVAHSPYFMYFGIDLEERNNEVNTHLWEELLKSLYSPGKTNIDNTLKRTCLALRIVPINSSFLAIYRWSQCALDIPVSHPLLPLVWQRFFQLYLQRVPGCSTIGSVGSKFFEGLVNGNYQKKLKEKLQQCVEYASKIVTSCSAERTWFNDLASLYRMYFLWLEEPRLHEPIYIPSLSVQYNPQKLELLLSDDQSLWLEYVDFNQIRKDQKEYVDRWNEILRRTTSRYQMINRSKPDVDVSKRILIRLNSYDSGFPPPPLIIIHPVMPPISRDILISKSGLLDYLADSFNTLMQFTKSFKMEWTDQNIFNKQLLEALRNLYFVMETETKFYAACDTDMVQKKTVSSLACAGAALIRIKVQQARKDKAIEHKIENCNREYERLLNHNTRSPPFRFTLACIILEHTIELLTNEKEEAFNLGDELHLSSLFDVGIALFYKVAFLYDSDVAFYFPTKLLIRRIVQTLGQAFIDKNKQEHFNLLSTIMKHSQLADILLPHFSPSFSSTSDFVKLYKIAVDAISTGSPPLQLVLEIILHFNTGEWLQKKPRLSERSKFIEVVSQALKQLGPLPAEALIPAHEILRSHFSQMLVHQFPEHYGEILDIMLKYSEEVKLAPSVWFDALNSLIMCVSSHHCDSGKLKNMRLKPGVSMQQIGEVAKIFAASQRKLTYRDLADTVNVLESHFVKERSRYGLYGLYPQYNRYMDSLIALHSIIGHSFIASIYQAQRGTLADKLSEQIWPVLLKLFSPWILPYFTAQFHEPVAPWIQQLTNDRSVLLPWILEDSAIAFKMVSAFTECLIFVVDVLPASSVILQYVCQWYISYFAQKVIEEHILNVIHNNLLNLPWSRFYPSADDLECMLKVVNQYLPQCHSFLALIFIEIPWHIVAYKDVSSSLAIRTHIALLHLLIKMANEPKLKQTGKISALLIEAQHFSWHLVDVTNYEAVVNWFINNFDPRVVLQTTDEDWNAVDSSAFDLLQVAAGFVPSAVCHSTTLQKRQIFVRAYVKMILSLSYRYRMVVDSHRSSLSNSCCRMLDKIESIVSSASSPENNNGTESGALLVEILELINQSNNTVLSKIISDALLNWLTHRAGNSAVLQGLFYIIASSITDYNKLGTILEASVSAWFKNSAGMEEYDWDKLLAIFQSDCPLSSTFEDALLSNNQILSLYTLALKELQVHPENISLSKVIRWSIRLKPSADMESKMPLLWSLVFKVCANHRHEIITCLMDFANYLQQLTQLKQGWALLGVIGLNKQVIPSVKCKLLCYAVSAFILAKLLVEKDDLETELTHSNSGITTGTENNNNAKDISSLLSGSECMKSVIALDSMMADKNYVEYRVIVEMAIEYIKSEQVNLYMGEQFVLKIANLLYTDGYIHAFPTNDLSV